VYVTATACDFENKLLKFADSTKIFGQVEDEMDKDKIQKDNYTVSGKKWDQ